jgi:hypothetical protein
MLYAVILGALHTSEKNFSDEIAIARSGSDLWRYATLLRVDMGLHGTGRLADDARILKPAGTPCSHSNRVD